jgi:hypothetical protein
MQLKRQLPVGSRSAFELVRGVGHYRHSSFSSGLPVYVAGTWTQAEDKQLRRSDEMQVLCTIVGEERCARRIPPDL